MGSGTASNLHVTGVCNCFYSSSHKEFITGALGGALQSFNYSHLAIITCICSESKSLNVR